MIECARLNQRRDISIGLVDGAVVTFDNRAPITSTRNGITWRKIASWKESGAAIFPSNVNSVVGQILTHRDGKPIHGTHVTTRTDDGRNIPIFEHTINNNAAIFFTSVARSCCDGAIPNVRRSTVSQHHGAGNINNDALSITNIFAIDPFDIPYVALPWERGNQTFSDREVSLGDIVAVIHDNKLAFGIYATNGPRHRIGEVSMRLQKELFNNENPMVNGTSGYDVTYIVFPNSQNLLGISTNSPNIQNLTFDRMQRAGRQLLGI